jgi:hypothetical protein
VTNPTGAATSTLRTATAIVFVLGTIRNVEASADARFMVALPNNAADEAGASDGASQLNAVSGRPAALSSG